MAGGERLATADLHRINWPPENVGAGPSPTSYGVIDANGPEPTPALSNVPGTVTVAIRSDPIRSDPRSNWSRRVQSKRGRPSRTDPFVFSREAVTYWPEPGPYITSTRRFWTSRTPSAVSTRGRLSPNASVEIEPSVMPCDDR